MESLTCAACNTNFKSKQELDDHNKRAHPEPERAAADAGKEKR